MQKLLLFLIINLCICDFVFAQEEIIDSKRVMTRDSIIDVTELYKEKIEPRKAKKKVKKNVYYGLKTRKAFTRNGFDVKETVELFSILKRFQEPDPFVLETYWYDIRKGKILIGKIPEKDLFFAQIPHGPYKKLVNDIVIEEGVFYIGTKHARWEKYDKNNNLIEKTKYYKGWPKESKIEFWDLDQKKIKEIVPYVNGQKHGKYLKFHQSGNVNFEGLYQYGSKVGIWTEWFDSKGKKRKEIKYPDEYYETAVTPIVVKEWTSAGKLTLDKSAEFRGKKTTADDLKSTTDDVEIDYTVDTPQKNIPQDSTTIEDIDNDDEKEEINNKNKTKTP